MSEIADITLSDADRERLVELRGGCTCFLSPPCGQCVEPMTEEEAEILGLLPAEPVAPTIDHMKAVRGLCK